MEMQEIKQALLEFIPLVREAHERAEPYMEVREHMVLFLERVLGYDLKEDIVFKELRPQVQRPVEVEFDRKVKFVMLALPSATPLDEEQEELAIEYALAVPANVVMLSNGVQLAFYSVDRWDDHWEIDVLEEINLLEGDPGEMSGQLWALAKKDCGRKIWVNAGPQGA